MVILQSRTIQAVAYDERKHLLRAKFRFSGKTLIYQDVPRDVYDSLIFADSIGAYFRDHIYGHYPVSKT
jgi:hypothetical protein